MHAVHDDALEKQPPLLHMNSLEEGSDLSLGFADAACRHVVGQVARVVDHAEEVVRTPQEQAVFFARHCNVAATVQPTMAAYQHIQSIQVP